MARNVSTIYDDGVFTKTFATYRGNPFFRKMFYTSVPPKPSELQRILAETSIARILMEHPHPNIVSYYRIHERYIDMEKVSVISIATPLEDIIPDMVRAKDFLQGLGIIYMDWKLDNMGKSRKGYTLYDFDGSGLVVSGKWSIEPEPFWSFRQALQQGITDPYEMDNWSFQNCFSAGAH